MVRDLIINGVEIKERWSNWFDSGMGCVRNIVNRVDESRRRGGERRDLLASLQYHLSQGPTYRNIAHGVHGLEGRSSKSFVFGMLCNSIPCRAAITSGVDYSRETYAFMEYVHDPRGLEALQLQARKRQRLVVEGKIVFQLDSVASPDPQMDFYWDLRGKLELWIEIGGRL